jgi:hypothetical protein
MGEDFAVDFAARATRTIPKVDGLRGLGARSVLLVGSRDIKDTPLAS